MPYEQKIVKKLGQKMSFPSGEQLALDSVYYFLSVIIYIIKL